MKALVISVMVAAALAAVPTSLADFPHNWSNHGYPGWVTDGPIDLGNGEFTISTHDLQTWNLFPGGGLAVQVDMDPNAPGVGVDMAPAVNNAEFQLQFTQGPGAWRSGQLGWSMFAPYPNYADDTLTKEFYDVSAYKSWMISFHNEEYFTNQPPLNANLFMNIGWTDIGETNWYVQSTWTLAEACKRVVLHMDFANVEVWANGQYLGFQDITSDPRLKHVSSLGVQIGSDVYPGAPALVKICLDTIPAPGAALLVALGMGLVGWAKRRFA